MKLPPFALCLLLLGCNLSLAQDTPNDAKFTGPTKDVTFHVLWLIESDDENRIAYDGPTREGLTAAGYGRLVPAGSAASMVSIGQRANVAGSSRYGQMSVVLSMLNTDEQDELQVKIELQSSNRSPMSIGTTARAPLGRWFLVGAADSRVGLPLHADDGKRAVAIMKIDDGVLLLD
ncbi:hypothetical protein [Stieleria varia]|nr:hypothetical protein [Stieleria varia]